MAKSSVDISGFVHAAMIGSKAGPLMLLTLMKAQTPRRNDALAKKNCLALMLPIPPLALIAADGSLFICLAHDVDTDIGVRGVRLSHCD